MKPIRITIIVTSLFALSILSFTASGEAVDQEYVKELYSYSCQACHESEATGAPLTGNENQWKERMSQGMDTLLDHTINGYQGMPPLGSCGDCTREDFVNLINFMSTSKPK